jgi:MFS family permease
VPTFELGGFVRGFYVSPRKYPDFAWAWITRFLVSLGNAMATIYLLFFLQDAVKVKNPDQGQLILIVIYTVGIIVTTVIFGMWSDRVGRRKIFVIWSTVLMAVAAVILALIQTFPAAMIAAAILGIGYGAYLAVDQALITQVLPAQIDRARDLGVINIANSLPQVLAPVIAARIVKGQGAGAHLLTGYTGLYLATAAITLLAAVLVNPIKSVR